MHDKNYEEYMSSVLGYNINQENTYCSYDYDNFFYDLEKKYPAVIQNLIEEVRKVDIKSCQNNFDEMLQEIYKNLKIKDNAKDMKDTIIDLLKIIIIKEKIEEHQMEMRNKNLYLNRGMRGYNPYIEF